MTLVEQLRKRCGDDWACSKVRHKAANEIERLQAENRENLRRIMRAWGFTHPVDQGRFDTVEAHLEFIAESRKMERDEMIAREGGELEVPDDG